MPLQKDFAERMANMEIKVEILIDFRVQLQAFLCSGLCFSTFDVFIMRKLAVRVLVSLLNVAPCLSVVSSTLLHSSS